LDEVKPKNAIPICTTGCFNFITNTVLLYTSELGARTCWHTTPAVVKQKTPKLQDFFEITKYKQQSSQPTPLHYISHQVEHLLFYDIGSTAHYLQQFFSELSIRCPTTTISIENINLASDGSVKQGSMAAACVTQHRAYICKTIGSQSSYRAEAAGKAALSAVATPNTILECDNYGLLQSSSSPNTAVLTSQDHLSIIHQNTTQKSLTHTYVPGHSGHLSNELCDLLCDLAHMLPPPPITTPPPGAIVLKGEIIYHPKTLLSKDFQTHSHTNIQRMCFIILKKHGPPHILHLWILGILGMNGYEFPNSFWYENRIKKTLCVLCNKPHNHSVYGQLLQCCNTETLQAKTAFLSLFGPLSPHLKSWLSSKERNHQELLITTRGLLTHTFVSYLINNKLSTYSEIYKSYKNFCKKFVDWFKLHMCKIPTPLPKTIFSPKPDTRSWESFLNPCMIDETIPFVVFVPQFNTFT